MAQPRRRSRGSSGASAEQQQASEPPSLRASSQSRSSAPPAAAPRSRSAPPAAAPAPAPASRKRAPSGSAAERAPAPPPKRPRLAAAAGQGRASGSGDGAAAAAPGKASRFRGVGWRKDKQRWFAELSVDGRRQFLGLFEDEEEARAAYVTACREAGRDPDAAPTSSRHRGVSWEKRRRQWKAQIQVNGKNRCLGLFHDEDEAARAYAAACHELGRDPINRASGSSTAASRPKNAAGLTSDHRGVSWKRSLQKWEVAIRVDGKLRRLGTFNEEDEEDAARAYVAACREIGRDPNPPASEKTSQFRGVSWQKSTSKWKAGIMVGGKVRFLGYFDDEGEAARAYAAACHELGRDPTNPRRAAPRSAAPATSRFRGVSWNKGKQRWQAKVTTMEGGKGRHIGYFEDEEEAGRAYAAACREAARPVAARPTAPAERTSCYRGVSYVSRCHKKWRAKITVDNKDRHLGNFETEDEAARAYAAACREIGREPTPAPSSSRRGVSWSKGSRKWRATIWIGDRKRSLGYFDDEAEAASAYAAACREAGRDPTPPAPEKTSRYRGVCWDRKGNKWRARIKLGGKEWNLGGYEDEEAAAGAFLAACLNARDDPSWTPPRFCPG